MTIAYLIPGTGEAFYCENCHRDLPLISEMRRLGHEILAVPLYLPLLRENSDPAGDTRIYFGAIDMYLAKKVPFYSRLPLSMRRSLDNPALLSLAARFAGSTSPEGLESMTMDMLDPDFQHDLHEARSLCDFLSQSEVQLIHISNALLLGLGVYLKRELHIPLVCTLQDEDTWIDEMRSPYREEAWQRISRLSEDTDFFLPVSSHYDGLFKSKCQSIQYEGKVVPIGLDIEKYPYFPPEEKEGNPLTLAYLSHQKEGAGLDILAENYRKLRLIARFSRLRLVISGGSTSSDRSFVRKVKRSLKREIAMGDVIYYDGFELKDRIELLREAHILSVPMERGEAFGTYLIEAMACGIPVVQPCSGAFPEIINNTGGGLLYDCTESDSLFNQLKRLLGDPSLRKLLSQKGRRGVEEHYSQKNMADLTARVYEELI